MEKDVLIHRIKAVNRMGREYCGGVVVIDFETTTRHNNTPKGSGLRCKQRLQFFELKPCKTADKGKADVKPSHTAR
jgi:hypothetical protein